MDTTIERHGETSGIIRNVFYAILSTCLFCIATLFNTEDSKLHFVNSTVKLPLLNYDLGFVAFLAVGPAIIMALTVYLHIFLSEHMKIEVPAQSRKAALFNLDSPIAKSVVWLIFYWISPVTLAVFTWKAWPIPTGGYILFGCTLVLAAALSFVQIRRCAPARRAWAAPLTVAVLVLFVAALATSVATRKISLAYATLEGFDFRQTNFKLIQGNTSGLILTRANLNRSNLSGQDLKGAFMNGTSLMAADLTNAILENARLRRANLSNATLFEADSDRAIFAAAILTGTDFTDAELIRADFTGASMNGTNFSDADLSRAIFSGGALNEGTNFSNATLALTEFSSINLSQVKGLLPSNLGQACLGEKVELPAAISEFFENRPQPEGCRGASRPTSLTVGGQSMASLSEEGETVLLDFTIASRGLYQIEAKSGSEFIDPRMMLFRNSGDSEFAEIASDDDGGPGLSARIIAELEPGNFQLGLSEYYGQTGDIDVSLINWDGQSIAGLGEEPWPLGGDIDRLGTVPIRNRDLSIDKGDGYRWFGFRVPQDGDYIIQVIGRGDADPYLYLFDPSRRFAPLAENDDSDGLNARLVERLVAGNYVMAIKSLDEPGEFRLSVMEADQSTATNGKRPLRLARKGALVPKA